MIFAPSCLGSVCNPFFYLSRRDDSMVNRNPVYHQFVFGFLVITTVIRVMYILKYTDAAERIPQKKKADIANFFTTGAIMFATGFGVWNLDNVFCGYLTNWKLSLGWPWAFLLEGGPLFWYTRLS